MIFRPKVITALALAIALSACQSFSVPPAPKSPAQAVFELKAAEGTALVYANAYKSLPTCPISPVCKTDKVVDSLKTADSVAVSAIDKAEVLVRNPVFRDDPVAKKALSAAITAVSALTEITKTLKVK